MSSGPENRPIVPDHELLRRIGRGSYGEVWLARNVMGSFRAVKVVYRASFDSDRPYEREFNGLEKFEPVSRTHPGFVSILHIGRSADAGCFYCVMEAADDAATGPAIDPQTYQPRTLAGELAKRGRLPLGECLELGAALATALGHLHARGLVHRDIKPSNIIFVNGAPKFADIGLVTSIGTKATFVGTEGYIPPEGPGSPGADLYSLGRVLYEISLGKSQDQFPELPTRLREQPKAAGLMRLNAIVLRACDPQPSKRFRSAEEFQAALAALSAETGGLARRPGELKAVIVCCTEFAADAAAARLLAAALSAKGFIVFFDSQPTLSVEWARRIEHEIRNAQAIIPILSPSSIHHELVAYPLEIARQVAQRPERRPLLAPFALPLQDPLPRQMALALENALPLRPLSTESDAQAIEIGVATLDKALSTPPGTEASAPAAR